MSEKITKGRSDSTRVKFGFNYKLFAAAMAVLTPMSYLVGFAFHQGLLAAYGISTESFPLSIQNAYIHAFFAIGTFLIEGAMIALDLIKRAFENYDLSLMFFLVVALVHYSGKKISRTKIYSLTTEKLKNFLRKIIRSWNKNHLISSLTLSGLASYLIYAILALIMSLAILWWLIPYGSYKLGYSQSL